MFLIIVVLSTMFIALAWHDEPARQPVIERRPKQKRLPYE
jgi:hypothetical protein